MFTELALCSLLCIYLPIYNQSPLHWPTGNVQPPQMQLQQLKLLTNTTRRDSKQRCNYVLSIGFLCCFFPYQRLRHPRFAPALLAFCFGQLAMGRTRTRIRHDVSVVVMVMVCAQWQNREAHSNLFLSESSFHNYRNKHCVWRV